MSRSALFISNNQSEDERKISYYWNGSEDSLFEALHSSRSGLSTFEAQARSIKCGPNSLQEEKKFHLFGSFISKFTSPLIIILIFADLVSVFLGQVIDFILIFLIILASGLIDFIQEYKSDTTVKKLRERVSIKVCVRREGEKYEINISNIVPGDIVCFSAGDLVPADCRIISARDFFVDQSALTGESMPVEKVPGESYSQNLPLSELKNSVFLGTSVVSGEAEAVVCLIGGKTEYGRLAKKLIEKRPETSFEIGIRNFGYLIMKVTSFLILFVFFFNVLVHHDVLNSFLFALALAVGIIPELLPMIITINLSQGALFMSKKDVIVKHLPSIQNLGGMDILCTDKTGTLTEGKIKLERYENCHGSEDRQVLLYAFLNSHFQTVLRSPMDEAVMSHRDIKIEGFIKEDEIPFDYSRKRLSVIASNNGKKIIVTKGAPENVLPICHYFQDGSAIKELEANFRDKLKVRFELLSREGYRVLALSTKIFEDSRAMYFPSDETEMVFLGFLAFLDPPKSSAKQTIKILEKQGISLIVLTGDNDLVTRKVCEELGLPIKGIITSTQLSQTSDESLLALIESANIFTRLSPDQKTRVIQALRKSGHVVGYLGDGINDAPSLRAADVGISVNNATDIAKESADIILLTKSLRVISDGVYEGRKTFANILKYIMMATSSNFGNMFSVAVASVFLPFIPMLPVQILLNNFLYDLSQVTIHADNVDFEDITGPRRWDVSFIRRFMIVFGPISSLFDFITFGLLLVFFKASEPVFQSGWFIESLATQILIIFSIRTKAFPFFRSRPSLLLVIPVLMMVIFGVLATLPPFNQIFSFGSLPPLFYLLTIFLVGTYFLLVEFAKTLFYSKLIRKSQL